MIKFNKSREWLIEEYVIKKRKIKDLAPECGLSVGGLKSRLLKEGIKQEPFNIDIELLRHALEVDKLSVQEVSEKYGYGKTTIRRYAKANNIQILAQPKKHEQYDDSKDELICSFYSDGFSSTQIGKILGISHNTVLTHLKHCGIQRKTLSEAQFAYHNKTYPEDFKDKKVLEDLYITQHLSKKDIAKMYGCDPCAVDLALTKLDIPIRNNSESKKGLMVGDKHPNWQGGITPLHLRLREYFSVQQVPVVLKRDHYQCQLCGDKSHLQVHHKIHFSEILRRIIKEHPELDPVKDINELYNIAIKDP
jgi:hypothetical protein